jgi:hypothetical protein
MINLDDWRDYQVSYDRLNLAREHLPDPRAARLIKIGVLNMINKGGFVKEDFPIAESLAGIDAQTSNTTSN